VLIKHTQHILYTLQEDMFCFSQNRDQNVLVEWFSFLFKTGFNIERVFAGRQR